MSLAEQIHAQALLMAGQLTPEQDALLGVLCQVAKGELEARLRPEDCKADFIAAASLFALAAMNAVGDVDRLEQVTAGDLTLRKMSSTDAASNCLRNQAELMIAPYLKDRFSFRGV